MDLGNADVARKPLLTIFRDGGIPASIGGASHIVEIAADSHRKFRFYAYPKHGSIEYTCIECNGGLVDKLAGSDTSSELVFIVNVQADGKVAVNNINSHYIAKSECQRWLKVLDHEWSGVISNQHTV